GGTVGAARVARARADGHTLLLADNAIATAPSLYRKLPFEPLRDFAPIGLADRMPLVLVARAGLPLREAGSVALVLRPGGTRPDRRPYAPARRQRHRDRAFALSQAALRALARFRSHRPGRSHAAGAGRAGRTAATRSRLARVVHPRRRTSPDHRRRG